MKTLSINDFRLENGNKIHSLNLAFETFGKLNENKDNVIWVCHALTANANVLDWWEGLFGIYNILNMLIYEKMNDIAILKATGFSGKDVMQIFLSQALIIGIIGGLLGLLFGFGVSVLISRAPFETEALPTVKTMPVNFDYMYYIIGIIFALISTFLAGYLPAKKAQRIDPVEIIRGQ